MYMGVTFYLILSFVFIMCLVYEDAERVLGTIWSAYVISALVAAALAIAGFFHLLPGSETFARGGGRAQGLFKDPNVMSPYLVPAIVYLFSKFESRPGRQAIPTLALMLALSVGMLLAFSRGAAGNLVLTFLAYVFLRLITSKTGPSVKRLLGSAILITVVATAVLSWVILNTDAGQLFAFKARAFQYYDVKRFTAQEEGIQTILSWPFGIGPGLAEQALAAGLPSHSLLIQVFLEDGWLAGIALITLLGVTMLRSIRIMRTQEVDPQFYVTFVSVLGILANSLFIDSTHWRHLWLLLGMLWGQLLVATHLRGLATSAKSAAPQQRRNLHKPAFSTRD
jgi:O-antigen ligase